MSALRGYQAEGIEAVYGAWSRGLRRVGVSLPTGTGKTHMMAEIGRREVVGGGHPTMFLLHRDTLVDQTAAKLRATLPHGTSVGVVKAERNEVGARVLIASVHTLRGANRRAMLPRIGTCVVDEAHVSVSPTYRSVFDHIGAFEVDGARLVGFSATWQRGDGVGLGDVWQDVVYSRTIKWATANGHLVRPRGIQVGEGVDLEGVPVKRDGDYREAELGQAVMLEDLRDTVVRGALRFGGDRPGVLFAPTVASAEYFAAALTGAGLRTEGIYHDTSPAERRRRFADHQAGRTRILSTCTALAEGWDSPHTGVLHLLRPMRKASQGLFVQIAGRILRPWPGKHDALILDYVGALDEVELRGAVDLSPTRHRATDLEGLVELTEPALDADEYEEPTGDGRVVRRRQTSREVELFAGTSVAWQTTPDGIPFVACGDRFVFVVPTPTGWSVGECATYTHVGGRFLAEGLDAQDALEVAADHAEATGRALSSRAASWRRREPSSGMVSLALQLGLEPERKRQGELSAEIDMVVASRTLRPLAEWSAAQMHETE